MARFEAGQSGNIAGRPKGAINKTTQTRKNKLEQLVLAIENDYLDEDLATLSAKERMRVYLACHDFLLPKLRSVAVSGVTEVEELMSMTAEQRAVEIKRIKEQLAKKDQAGSISYETEEEYDEED